jgi:hypothetical protein
MKVKFLKVEKSVPGLHIGGHAIKNVLYNSQPADIDWFATTAETPIDRANLNCVETLPRFEEGKERSMSEFPSYPCFLIVFQNAINQHDNWKPALFVDLTE